MPVLTKRRLLRLLLVALVLLVAFVGFLPTLVGTKWLYQPLIDQLAADQFHLTIDSVRLRWFSPFQLDGIKLNEANGPSLITVRRVRTDRSLFGYIIGGKRLGKLEVDELTIAVELLKDGSNLERVIKAFDQAAASPQKKKSAPPAIDIDVIVRNISAKVMQETAGEPLVVVPPFNLEASYQAASGDSHFKLKATRILDRVTISKELIDLGLGHAVPLLAKSAWFDGQVSLDVGDIDVPLKDPQQTKASLELTLHQVRSGPSDPTILRAVEFIGSVSGHSVSRELVFVDGSEIAVQVANARVHHEGLRFGFPKMDNRFQVATSGYVGIADKSLDLIIEVPVPVEHLARRESVQAIGVPTLKLPITGTLDKPQLNWEAMRGDVASLLGTIKNTLGDDAPTTAKVVGAMEGLAGGQADETISAVVDVLQQFRQRRQTQQEHDQENQPDSTNEDKPKSNQPVRDALRDFFRKKKT